MDKPHYQITSSADGFWYEFDSISKEKTIRKAVAYYPYSDEIFQLVFGNLVENNIDTLGKSNNQDMKMVLTTVIQTLIYFLELYPQKSVIFTGSTPSRTRLYRATISKLLIDLDDTYNVRGILPNFEVEDFEASTEYYAYLISKK
jgi:hypothetical protein